MYKDMDFLEHLFECIPPKVLGDSIDYSIDRAYSNRGTIIVTIKDNAESTIEVFEISVAKLF